MRINGKKVIITSSGYLYVDDKRVSEQKCTPLSCPLVDDDTVNKYVQELIFRRWTMVNN